MEGLIMVENEKSQNGWLSIFIAVGKQPSDLCLNEWLTSHVCCVMLGSRMSNDNDDDDGILVHIL